jgi:hypothetical protein
LSTIRNKRAKKREGAGEMRIEKDALENGWDVVNVEKNYPRRRFCILCFTRR